MKPIRFLRAKASEGLDLLVESLRVAEVDVKKIKLSGSSYRGNSNHLIINWGSSSYRDLPESIGIFNRPGSVAIATNKLKTFNKLVEADLGYYLPMYLTSYSQAKRLVAQGFPVYCRTTLSGCQGSGIVIAKTPEEIVSAQLYTMKVPINKEYRIHVFNREIIDVAEKRRVSSSRREEENILLNEEIRNFENGWRFCREDVNPKPLTKSVAIQAVDALQLDFGAVDICEDLIGRPIIFEINTAPGVEGTTVEKYRDAIITLAA